MSLLTPRPHLGLGDRFASLSASVGRAGPPAIRGPTGRSAPEPELRSALQKLNGSTGSQVVHRQARHRDPSSRELRAMSRFLRCRHVIVYCVTRSHECCGYGAIVSRGWMARVAVPRPGSTEERI